MLGAGSMQFVLAGLSFSRLFAVSTCPVSQGSAKSSAPLVVEALWL